MPLFVLSARFFRVPSKALEVNLAPDFHHELYHKICSIVDTVKAALLSNADSIIVAHNHPAGSLRASSEDVQTTIQLLNAGQMLGVPVLDHIIVARGGIASIREEYPELWKPPVVSD